ncbi:MAG: hypothetical protein U1F33_12345 [Alphaproteobacteria bacterium]
MKSFAVILVAALSLGPLAAQAAPQVLALMPTEGAKPLVCEGEICRGEFSAICLQEARKVPTTGTVYELLPGSEVSVAVVGRDGQSRAVDLTPTVTTLRGQLAMEIAVPRHGLDEDATVTVRIPKTVFILPKPVAGDTEPITAAELSGVLRQHVEIAPQFEKDVAAGLASTRLLSLLLATLPKRKLVPAEERHIVEATLARFDRKGNGPEARALGDVRGAFENCDIKQVRQVYGGVRTCLQVYHDSRMIGVNTAYWDRVRKKKGGG